VNPALAEAIEAAGLKLSVEGLARLTALRDWLRREAIPAGGLGPREGKLVETRHLADSVLFAVPFDRAPAECWDLGSGVGLPGLVLAVVWPETSMVLIDRSRKRCDLAKRAARVIEVEVDVDRLEVASGHCRGNCQPGRRTS
jgi:16S rRNA (guanine527-N7)-methyltransferase